MFDDFEEELNCFTKKTSGCLIKLAKSSKKQPQQEEEPEIHFNRKKNKQESNQEETSRDEEFIKQQKKIGLMCNCELETVLREVKKDGPNKGKLFYTCSKNYENKCDYFMWKDESDNKINKLNQTKTNADEINTNNTDEINTNNTDETKIDEPLPMSEKEIKQQQKLGLMCYCKLPSVSREVKKNGANKGKIFYTCSRYYDDKCKYFVWKDEIKK
jgi:hypothetical protein